MTYQIHCPCGAAVPVEFYQAGTEIPCQNCKRLLMVPNSMVLQELAQERHPHLSAIDKLKAAIAEESPPFDGQCQRCKGRRADVARPVTFCYLTERVIQGEDGPQIDHRGVALVVGASEETWETITFPLLLCDPCECDFRRGWWRSWWLQSGSNLLLAAIAGPVLLIGIVLVVALPLIGAGLVIVVIAMLSKYLLRKKASPYVHSALQAIPLVSTAIDQEDEYSIKVGSPKHLSS